MQELDGQIAQTDEELAAQTRNLLSVGEGAERAYREQMELKAEVITGGFFMKPAPARLHDAASWHASSIDYLVAHSLSWL